MLGPGGMGRSTTRTGVIMRQLIVCMLLLVLAGCSHNPAVITMGKRTNIGFDPGQMSANISWTDGLNVVDVPRENSSIEIEVDEGNGLSFDKATNTIRGVKKITRKTGIQITGYLVELAEASPEAAVAYIKQAAEINHAEPAKTSQPSVTLSLPQANGIPVSVATLAAMEMLFNADTSITVPEGINLTLNKWKLLKAAYLMCPECLELTEEETAILKKATTQGGE